MLALSLLVGCTKPDPWGRVALKGNVTTTEIGNPDEINGRITIVPAAGNRGPSAVAAIKAGKYEYTAETGPVSGSCRAVIELLEPQPFDPKAEPGRQAGAGQANARRNRLQTEILVPAEKRKAG